VIDKSLSSLPRRKTDNSFVIRCQSSDLVPARVFKLNAVAGDAVLIERYAQNVSLSYTCHSDFSPQARWTRKTVQILLPSVCPSCWVPANARPVWQDWPFHIYLSRSFNADARASSTRLFGTMAYFDANRSQCMRLFSKQALLNYSISGWRRNKYYTRWRAFILPVSFASRITNRRRLISIKLLARLCTKHPSSSEPTILEYC
jgi:hypothetical protein